MLALRAGLPGRLGLLRTRMPVRFALVCGLIVAGIGWASSGATFGTGYPEARALVQQDPGVPGEWFALLKALASLVSYVAGIPGGIFAPSLAVGAGLGGTLSLYLHFAPAGAVVVLTMAAYFSGVVQAPLTALVIVSEMTGNGALTLPLMAVTLLGRGASALLCPEALYRALAVAFMEPATPVTSAPPGVMPDPSQSDPSLPGSSPPDPSRSAPSRSAPSLTDPSQPAPAPAATPNPP
jgi:H+/Cl- antiporter ClcA